MCVFLVPGLFLGRRPYWCGSQGANCQGANCQGASAISACMMQLCWRSAVRRSAGRTTIDAYPVCAPTTRNRLVWRWCSTPSSV